RQYSYRSAHHRAQQSFPTRRSSDLLFKEETIADWAAYLEKYDAKTVEYYLYDNELNTVLAEVSSSKNPIEAFNTHVSKQYALNSKDAKSKNLFEFMLLSRGIETYSNQTYNYWDYNNRTQLNAEQNVVQKIEQTFNKASKKDVFYKNRLWFQV